MKHYLYRAKFLIIIYSLIAMLLNLGSMAYIKHLNDFKAFPELSSEYAVGEITSGKECADLRGMLLQATSEVEGQHLLASEFYGIQGFAVYYTDDSCFPLEIEEGRSFSKEDFLKQRNVVLVNENTKSQCLENKGSCWWDYGGTLFEVIGVYSDTDDFGNKSPSCFLNYTAKALEPAAFSGFIYDAKGNSSVDMEHVKEAVESWSKTNYLDYAPINTEYADEFLISNTNFTPMLMMLLLTTFLILLNSISAGHNWIESRKKEIGVRKLAGASQQSIYRWLGCNFLSMIGGSFVIGVVLSKLFLIVGLHTAAKESVQLMFGLQLQWKHVALGFLAVVIVCGIVSAITVYHFQKQEIARIIK